MSDDSVASELAVLPQRVPINGLADTGAPEPAVVSRPFDEGSGGQMREVYIGILGVTTRVKIPISA